MTEGLNATVESQIALADHIVDAVVKDATGEADGDRCVGEPPSAKYYLATLAPRDLDLAAGRERRGRETPRSAGFEMEVLQERSVFRAQVSMSCYYRVLPTFEEQLGFAGGEEEPSDRPGREYRLAPVFQRVDVQVGPMTVQLDPGNPLQHVGSEEFIVQFQFASERARADPSVDRREGDDRKDRFVPGMSLVSTEAFQAWISGLPGSPVVPEWAARITLLTRPAGGGRSRVAVSVENLSDDPVVTRLRRGDAVQRHDDSRDHFLFRVRLDVTADDQVIVPIETYLGPDAYRYDPRLPAYANNCGVAAEYDESGSGIRRLWSVPAPVYESRRLVSTDHPSTRFAALAADPIPLLQTLASDMRAWMASDVWSTGELREELAVRKNDDRRSFEDEIRRFEDGIRWLGKDERLLLAFKLANRAMTKLGEMNSKRHTGWRLFQVVFIVSQLSALAWREHDASEFTTDLWGSPDSDPTGAATVLYFPTSGGKTEAYLGLIACSLFYDRARGKARGVTAWCRFPLRLLTLQQTQRQVDFIAATEEVRSASVAELESVGGAGGDRFALGFFAGEGNTPNSLSRDQAVLNRLIADDERRREVRVVDECPYCRERAVEVWPPDPSELRLVHACRACGRELPVHVVDTEIYRYLPALIVGTLDKLANIGLTDRFGVLARRRRLRVLVARVRPRREVPRATGQGTPEQHHPCADGAVLRRLAVARDRRRTSHGRRGSRRVQRPLRGRPRRRPAPPKREKPSRRSRRAHESCRDDRHDQGRGPSGRAPLRSALGRGPAARSVTGGVVLLAADRRTDATVRWDSAEPDDGGAVAGQDPSGVPSGDQTPRGRRARSV